MIYCVEDDSSIRDLMLYTLNVAGFEAVGFSESKAFWERIKTERPQLVLLDIMLPEEDGLSILRKLKEDPSFSDIPVIMATAKGSEYDRVKGLDMGADDYLVKPFGMMEMISRIKAVLRRSEPKSGSEILRHEGIVLDTVKYQVTVDGKEVVLTLKEFELLRLFMNNIAIVFTRDRLLSLVWGMDYTGETRTVDVHIGTLRMKLEEKGRLIQTVRGVGYRME